MSCISPISQKEMKVPTTVSLSILAWICPTLIYVVYFSWPFWIWDIIEFDSLCLSDQLYRQSYHFSHCMINVSLFKVFFYLHKKASLLDTKNSRPGYCMINMESPPDILEYNFISQSLVDQYWVDLRHISINSHLGCKSKWLIYLSSINCYSHLGCKKECLPHDKPVYLYIKYSTQILVIFTCVNFALLQLQRICSFNNIWDNEIVS